VRHVNDGLCTAARPSSTGFFPDTNDATNNNPVSLTFDDVISVEIYVLLEGPYRLGQKFMANDLNSSRGLLPGQALIGLGQATRALLLPIIRRM